MDKILNLPSVIFSVCMTIGSTFFGGNDKILHAVIFFMICDYLTGVIASIILKQVSSNIHFRGFLKKMLMLITIAIAVELNKLIPDAPLREIVIYFYIANEGISILENICKFIPVPDKMKDYFLQLRE